MSVSEEILRYLPAAQIETIPHDLSKPRYLTVTSTAQRRKDYQACVAASDIWNSADTDEGRCFALESSKAGGRVFGHPTFDVLELFLQGDLNRLPPVEIENVLHRLGLTDENNEMLSELDIFVSFTPITHRCYFTGALSECIQIREDFLHKA